MEYITAREAAQKWKISPRLARQCCQDGRVPGARKFSGSWAIPAGAPKPAGVGKSPPPPPRSGRRRRSRPLS